MQVKSQATSGRDPLCLGLCLVFTSRVSRTCFEVFREICSNGYLYISPEEEGRRTLKEGFLEALGCSGVRVRVRVRVLGLVV